MYVGFNNISKVYKKKQKPSFISKNNQKLAQFKSKTKVHLPCQTYQKCIFHCNFF